MKPIGWAVIIFVLMYEKQLCSGLVPSNPNVHVYLKSLFKTRPEPDLFLNIFSGVWVILNRLLLSLCFYREAAERGVMFPESPLGIGKNYLIHRSDLLYFILFHDHNT